MRLYLAQSYPEGWGGVKLTSQSLEGHTVKLRILLSYWYYKDADLDELFATCFSEPFPDVFADSGGFSAMTQGAQIDVVEYANWIKRYKHLFTTYANLDVIGDAEETRDNQKRLEDLGLEPLPVFHTGENWEYLEWYVERYPYIALGGMVPYMRHQKKIIPWIIKAYKLAAGRSVFHGFGATSWNVINNFPWYSVDSSSWGMGFRYGEVPLFDERAGRFFECRLGDPVSCRKFAPLIRSFGFDPLDFADRSRNDRAKICAISAISYIKAEAWLRRRWGEIYIPGRRDAPAGLHLYLVDASKQNLADAEAGIRRHLADAAEGGLKLYLAGWAREDISNAKDVINRATETS